MIPSTGPQDTILVVDDTDVMRSVTVDMLAQAGYRVRSASCGEEALAEIDAWPPDLILLDICMPNLDGYEVCTLIKQNARTHSIPVIFMSALDDLEDKIKGFQSGGVDYITKPAQSEELIARVESQLALSRQRKQIEALSKLKDDLIGIVSHDLKNPLQVIVGYAEMLNDTEFPVDEETREDALRQIQKHGKYMLSIIFDLLDIRKIEVGMPLELVRVSLKSLLDDSYEAFHQMAEQNQIRLSILMADDDVMVRVDENRIKQVIRNLLSNALKYTKSGGDVLLSAVVEEDRFVIQVADTGVGISKEDLPHVFKKFYRVAGTQHMDLKGTGLGLSVVQAIVEQHGGTIWVNSIEGRGSTFCVALPL